MTIGHWDVTIEAMAIRAVTIGAVTVGAVTIQLKKNNNSNHIVKARQSPTGRRATSKGNDLPSGFGHYSKLTIPSTQLVPNIYSVREIYSKVILSNMYSVPSTQHSVLSTQYSALCTQYTVLIPWVFITQ